MLGAQAMGADLAYIGSAFIATQEANADPAYQAMIVASTGEDITYTNLFTGVHGNYLTPSIVAAGLDPANLPVSDASAHELRLRRNQKAKAWRDIWGCGQGIGAVKDVPSAAELIARLFGRVRRGQGGTGGKDLVHRRASAVGRRVARPSIRPFRRAQKISGLSDFLRSRSS